MESRVEEGVVEVDEALVLFNEVEPESMIDCSDLMASCTLFCCARTLLTVVILQLGLEGADFSIDAF